MRPGACDEHTGSSRDQQQCGSAAPGRGPLGTLASPLRDTDGSLPKRVRDILLKGRTSWLKNTEVLDLLNNYRGYGFPVSQEPPLKPPGGSLFLFNRKSVRFFRKDGHDWRKKSDGKTVRETHEKLKVGNKDRLNCYYAHAQQRELLQRRCYWMLEGEDNIVLVHYLNARAVGNRARQAHSERHDPIPAFIGRSGSVPDNFGSGNPAAWCVTSGDRASTLHDDLDSPLTYATADAQGLLPVKRDGGDISLQRMGSPADGQDSSRDGGSAMTAELADGFSMDTYSPSARLAADMDCESELASDFGVHLSRVSPFAAVPVLPPLSAPLQASQLDAPPPLSALPSISPFALATENSVPFESPTASPKDTDTFDFIPNGSSPAPFMAQRPSLMGFVRAASDGASLLRHREVGTPLSISTSIAPIRRSATASRPPMADRTRSGPNPHVHFKEEPDVLPRSVLLSEMSNESPSALNPHFPNPAHSQPWGSCPDSPLGSTFEEILQQCTQGDTFGALGQHRMLDTARAASVPGPLTGIDRTGMLEDTFSFGPYHSVMDAASAVHHADPPLSMLRQCSDSLAFGAAPLPPRSSGNTFHSAADQSDSLTGSHSLTRSGTPRTASFTSHQRPPRPFPSNPGTSGSHTTQVAIEVLQPVAGSAGDIKRDERGIANNVTVTFAPHPDHPPLARHQGAHLHAMTPEMTEEAFDGAVLEFLTEAQGSSNGLRGAGFEAGASAANDAWHGFSSDDKVGLEHSRGDIELMDAAPLALGLGSLPSWMGSPHPAEINSQTADKHL